MKADFDLIKNLTCGAVEVIDSNGVYEFRRMTAQQRDVLKNNQDFARKATATSGIRLAFATDAKEIRLAGVFSAASTRKFAFFDIKVNGILIQHSGTDNYHEMPEFDFTIQLDGKFNNVEIYFPCLANAAIRTLEFSGSRRIEAQKKKRKILCYGDSITQGYDAVYPMFAYANMLADGLDAEIFNKAIGAEVFNPPFADAPDGFTPDIITVAYGTNDWKKEVSAENITGNSTEFIRNLTRHYPDVPVFAILPIWRKDMEDTHASGKLTDAIELLKAAYKQFDNVTVIEGMPLVPHLPEFYADGYLHPNDTGFLLYGNNLLKAVKTFL